MGSSFDPATGTFIWQPGVAFIGAYDFAFTRRDGDRTVRQDVRIVLNPKGSNRVGPQVVIDYANDIVADGKLPTWIRRSTRASTLSGMFGRIRATAATRSSWARRRMAASALTSPPSMAIGSWKSGSASV